MPGITANDIQIEYETFGEPSVCASWERFSSSFAARWRNGAQSTRSDNPNNLTLDLIPDGKAKGRGVPIKVA